MLAWFYWALWLCRKRVLYVTLASRAAVLVLCAVNKTAAPSNVLAISAGSAAPPAVVLWIYDARFVVLGPTQHHALTCLCMRFVSHLRACVPVTLHCSRDDWLDAATSSTLKWLRPFASM